MNITLPIECADGHQYLLKLTDCKNIPIDSTIEIVDIALISMSKIEIINNAGTLNRIASILFNFLDENDVILYFYCSKDPIKQRDTRGKMSYQQYRSFLFTSMFDRTTRHHKGEFINKSIILKDMIYGDHYIHLVAQSKHSDKLDKLEGELNTFNK